MYKRLNKEELVILKEIANRLREKNSYIVMVANCGFEAHLVPNDTEFNDFCLDHKRSGK